MKLEGTVDNENPISLIWGGWDKASPLIFFFGGGGL
jgi:hypothetical protein